MTYTFQDDCKIIDFGSAARVEDNKGYLILSGTRNYFSPDRMVMWNKLRQVMEQGETEHEESHFHLTGKALKASDMWVRMIDTVVRIVIYWHLIVWL